MAISAAEPSPRGEAIFRPRAPEERRFANRAGGAARFSQGKKEAAGAETARAGGLRPRESEPTASALGGRSRRARIKGRGGRSCEEGALERGGAMAPSVDWRRVFRSKGRGGGPAERAPEGARRRRGPLRSGGAATGREERGALLAQGAAPQTARCGASLSFATASLHIYIKYAR